MRVSLGGRAAGPFQFAGSLCGTVTLRKVAQATDPRSAEAHHPFISASLTASEGFPEVLIQGFSRLYRIGMVSPGLSRS